MIDFKFFTLQDLLHNQGYIDSHDYIFKNFPMIESELSEEYADEGVVIIMVEDGDVLGSAVLTRLVDWLESGYISCFWINPGVRGRGYSKILLSKILELENPFPVKETRIYTDLWNFKMIKCIESVGFKEFHRTNYEYDQKEIQGIPASLCQIVYYSIEHNNTNKEKIRFDDCREVEKLNFLKYV